MTTVEIPTIVWVTMNFNRSKVLVLMPRILRRLSQGFCVLLILIGPYAMGSITKLIFLPLVTGSFILVIFGAYLRSGFARKATLVILSVALTVTICDIGLRLFNIVPTDLAEKWPRMPFVNRYVPNTSFQGHRFSDLARMTGNKEWIEQQRVRVIIDDEGFRNEGVDLNQPLDVIILGDSFGAGAVSQEDTWNSIFIQDYKLNTYNLSAPAVGPWQEYVNLLSETERIKSRPGSHLVWQLFTGNDLEDYYGSLESIDIAERGSLSTWLVRFKSFRARSPVRYLFQKHTVSNDVAAYDFLNGRKLLFYKPYMQTSTRTEEQILQDPNWERLKATVRTVKEFTDSRGLRLSIVLVPSKEEVYSWVWRGMPAWSTDSNVSGFSEALERICADTGIHYLDLKPSLVRESRWAYEGSGNLLYWYDDTHMNTSGSRFTARLIHDELLKPEKPPLENPHR